MDRLLLKRLKGLYSRQTRTLYGGLSSADFMKKPQNEPILDYMKGSKEMNDLQVTLDKYANTTTNIPIVIGGKEIYSDDQRHVTMPFAFHNQIGIFSYATKKMINESISNGQKVRRDWERTSLKYRAEIMLKAADLCAGKYRMHLNATTMLGQGKTVIQAEVDAACELIDFLRFNAYFALKCSEYEPISTQDYTDKMVYRGLEGFVASISPFNFTAIGGNLASCPALMGNVVLWKPSDTAILSNWVVYQILTEAGVPHGVIDFLPADGPVYGETVTGSRHLACVNFTGSVPTFKWLWKTVANNIDNYNTYPRLIGECGGKNFHFVHESADVDSVAACTIRGAFEYQGQKCSATSRMYVPQSMWPKLKDKLISLQSQIKMGDPRDTTNFISSVIDRRAFDRIDNFVRHAHTCDNLTIVAGGECNDEQGYFVQPTIVETKDPVDKIMTQEIFGPVVAIYPYFDKDVDRVLSSLKDSTQFGLTGAIFANDKKFLERAQNELRDACGNLYINDKSTGSIVGQQPFGGARMSGTNDKAGGPHYSLRFASPLTIKTTHKPQQSWKYPYMA